MPSKLLEALRTRVVVFDGAMGTQIHNRDLDLEKDYLGCENCTDVICVSRPDVIESIHRGYLEAGSDAVETNTFGGAQHVLSEFGLEGRCYEINRQAAEIARAACDALTTRDRPRFVIGSMGPGTKLITLGQISWEKMLASYREQVRGLLAGGADALLVETAQDLLQAKCLVNACLAEIDAAGKTPDDVPILVSITIETMGTMLVGSTIEAALMSLRQYPIASFGLNCATGPLEMGEHVSYLSRHWDRLISVMPNAGLPALVDGRTVYPLGPEAFAEALTRFIHDEGVNIVGGCCGTTPAHIAELAKIAHASPAKQRTTSLPPPSCSSLYSAVEFRQDQSFLIVGERCNASGSKKFRELLEAEDWDGMVSMARQQMREGSHLLDVNVDYAGRDNARDMAELVGRFAKSVDAPLMLDSTQIATIESGLRCTGGKCVINSANFEDGEEKFDTICRLAKRYGAGLVIGTIDEDREAAMARTADRKLAITKRAIHRATRFHGLDVADLFIDALVLPISTGMDADRRSALELIDGVRRISAQFPEVQLTCGVSNVSFGLKPAARVALNSVFLHELVQAGLTSAIVHSSKILPLHRIDEAQKQAALDLIYDRRHESRGGTGLPDGITDESFDPLQRLIDLFTDAGASASNQQERAHQTLEERLRSHIIDGERDGLTACLDEAMKTYTPLAIINDHLLDGMKTVGELFGSGQMQLPFVLQSAEVMKKAVAHLEPHMERVAGSSRGSIVLATVKGDVHDIGKNLVDIILSNNGFTVHNLGIKQPIGDILAAWKKTNADAIGLSGLLVKSVHVMEENIHELNAVGVRVPLILGGAALSRHYAEGHLRSQYQGPLYFGRDAFEGLRLMQCISDGRLGELDSEIDERMSKRSDAEKKVAEMKASRADRGTTPATTDEKVRSDVDRLSEIPVAPFFGTEVVQGIDLDDVYAFINKIALFRGQWQFKKGAQSDEDYERQIEETAGPIFQRVCARGRDEGILRPAVVYGYFPCASEGDHLVIFDPDDHEREIERFTFPRQTTKRRLCISDFFLDRNECDKLGRHDVIGLSCVTMGSRVSEITRRLFERGEYTEYLYMHGLGVEAAEGLAELWHKRMRQQLGIGGDDSPRMRELFQQKYRGSRYSFGYPACPDMSDQEKLFRLLKPERIGCVLTENWQIDPEQSTSAIVVHHPQAKYFNV